MGRIRKYQFFNLAKQIFEKKEAVIANKSIKGKDSKLPSLVINASITESKEIKIGVTSENILLACKKAECQIKI